MSAVVFIQASEEVNQNVNLQPEPKAPESRSLVAICEHIKDNGFRCGTPAVKGRPFCYYHGRAHAHTPRIGERGYRAPLVETVESLQLIVTQITEALGAGRITDKTAGKLLYAVQISSHLLKMKKEALGAGAPFKPSVVLSGEVQNAALTSEPATEVSEAMEVALRSRPLLDPAAAAYPNVVSEDDPEMPTTIEEAKRALFSPQQFVDFYKTLNNCDRLTSVTLNCYAVSSSTGVLTRSSSCTAYLATSTRMQSPTFPLTRGPARIRCRNWVDFAGLY